MNEPVLNYAPGSPERQSLTTMLDQQASERVEIPLIIGGREIRTATRRTVVMPHAHAHVLAEYCWAGPEELALAAQTAVEAQREWAKMSQRDRSAIFLKAADLLAGPWRDRLNAATMLGQSKNIYQAEIDAACELVDFLRFNVHFAERMAFEQPISPRGVRNSLEYRPLEGFVLAITPFNFTAIAGNLPTAPAILGNTAVWKPSDTQVLSAYYTYRLLEAAGLPPGVINFVPAAGTTTSETLLGHRELAGVHFTGSSATFQALWRGVSSHLDRYRSYPRIVGETGGKDFVFAHASADPDALAVALLRGAFEYQGQKCSAASRAYIPTSLWPRVRERLLGDLATVRMGDVRDLSCLINAVIDERSFARIVGYLEEASRHPRIRVLAGGKGDAQQGYFIPPTVLETADPRVRSMSEEIFGPVLTVFPYEDAKLDEAIRLCDETSPYALTGALFARERTVISELSERLRFAAGNFYINDKPTGAVVGQQPFGGGRASGTNDKAGSPLNLYRWVSPRTIKETFTPPTQYRYPFMG